MTARAYAELLSNDPAWPALEKAARESPNHVEILPPESEARRRSCLERLQVTTRSTLGAVAHETGGLRIDGGLVRVLGSGSSRLPRELVRWNEELGVPMASHVLVGDDAIGGFFALNGSGLPGPPGNVFYFAPDSLAWEDQRRGYSDWVNFLFVGDLAGYYETFRWPGWREEVTALAADHGLHFWPPPWTREGKDLAKVSRRAVPMRELYGFGSSAAAQLAGRRG